MRIRLQLSRNLAFVPFNYQRALVGAFHKWLGANELHDDLSLYSLSWLEHRGRPRRRTAPDNTGLIFPYGAEMFISSPLPELHKQAVDGIFKDQLINWGMRVESVTMEVPPVFSERARFFVQSAVLVKRRIEGKKHHNYYFYDQPETDALLTETLHRKLDRLGVSTDVQMRFDRDYPRPRHRLIRYNGLQIKGSVCPVIVEGNPEAVRMAWLVGAGNSTGIGFGALV